MAPNFHSSAKALGFDVDYGKLLDLFRAGGGLIRAYYYTAISEDQEFSSIRPLIDWLDYNGYAVVTKPATECADASGRRKVRGSTGVDIAVHAMEMADNLEHLVLFSGDGDFCALIAALQRKGVRVSVVSTIATQPPTAAAELRRQADEFVDLARLVGLIGREPGERSVRAVGLKCPVALTAELLGEN